MATLRHHIYSVREKLKELSDDQLLTDEFIKHLINTKRDYLLNQKYADIRKVIPEAVKQTIEFEMETTERVPGIPGQYVLVSKDTLPMLADLDRLTNEIVVSGRDVLESRINYVPYARFLYVGKDRWLKTLIYASIRAGKLYLKSGTFTEKGIEILNLTSVFADPEVAYNRSEAYDPTVEFEDTEYPLTQKLADTAIEMIAEELLRKSQLKPDDRNNADPN